jgi:hypothetical protein
MVREKVYFGQQRDRLPRDVRTHYFTRNRTQELDSFPFFSTHERSRTSFAVAFMCVSGNGKGVFLVVAPVRFLVKPLFLLAVRWCDPPCLISLLPFQPIQIPSLAKMRGEIHVIYPKILAPSQNMCQVTKRFQRMGFLSSCGATTVSCIETFLAHLFCAFFPPERKTSLEQLSFKSS